MGLTMQVLHSPELHRDSWLTAWCFKWISSTLSGMLTCQD